MSSLTFLELPRPSREEALRDPFDDEAPSPLAQRCAEHLMAQLRTGFIAEGVSTEILRRTEGGKMFGVLAVETPDGRLGYLRAFSGQLDRAWNVEGYAPPLFDPALRDAVEPPAEVVVKDFTARVERARVDPLLLEARAAVAAFDQHHAAERAELRALHATRKAERHAQRSTTTDPRALHALDQQSRADDSARRSLEATGRTARAALVNRLAPHERHLAALERLRRLISREAMRRIWDTYRLTNFANETTSLRDLFPGVDPSSGAGDCAAPKLFGAAQHAGLKPLALAEFWWGSAPPGGGRVEGMYFPSCKEKCGPVLPFLLRGLTVAPRRPWRPRAVDDDALTVIHEEASFVVLDKPEGLLSVPSREVSITDSVVAKVRRRWPHATGPLTVHRLDLDTSGLLLVALDVETYRLLQRQFLVRTVEKRYVAVVSSRLTENAGEIQLPLRVDLEQRPRQVVDFEHGRAAHTRWEVLHRDAATTRIALWPLTGRTHQLRVHAAHPRGLGAPIVGDRLYGLAGPRLLLHAESLGIAHPVTGERITFRSPVPF